MARETPPPFMANAILNFHILEPFTKYNCFIFAKVKVSSSETKKLLEKYNSHGVVTRMSTSSFETFSDWLEKRHKEKQNKSNQCDFVSVQGGDLMSHLKTHSREKSYKCNQCDYASIRSSRLKTHMKTHSGEKAYKCNQCDYASVEAGTLRRHLKTHSGERPYKCNQCGYASVEAGTLRRHLKTHPKEKMY